MTTTDLAWAKAKLGTVMTAYGGDPPPPPIDTPGGGSPYDGGMEARIAKLEGSMESVKNDLTALRADAKHFATKADVAEAKFSLIVWVVSAIFLAQLLPILPTPLRAFGLLPPA